MWAMGAAWCATSVQVSKAGAPMVTYRTDAGELRFANDSDGAHAARTTTWRWDGKCFSLEKRYLRKLSPDCGDPTFQVVADGKERDRAYPAAVQFANGGTLLYTSYLHVVDKDQLVPISVAAPVDGVARHRANQSASALTLAPSEFRDSSGGWIYLGPDKFTSIGNVTFLVDDGVPEEARQELMRMAPRVIEVYSSQLGVALASPVTIYLNWANREAPGSQFHADVVPGNVARLTIIGGGWKMPTAVTRTSFASTVAHELAHLWNHGIYRNASWSASWAAEGLAELHAWAALLHAGLATREQAAERLERASAECSIAFGERAWVKLPWRQGGRIPYECGLLLHFASVAMAQRVDTNATAFGMWRSIWASSPVYFEASPAAHLQRLGAEQQSRALVAVLTAADLPLGRGLQDLYRLGGVGFEAVAIPDAMRLRYAGAVVSAVMSMACDGSFGFRAQTDHFAVDNLQPPCAAFKQGMKIRTVAGVDVIEQPFVAAARIRDACTAKQSIHVGPPDVPGDATEFPCAPGYLSIMPREEYAVRFDPRAVAAVFGKPVDD